MMLVRRSAAAMPGASYRVQTYNRHTGETCLLIDTLDLWHARKFAADARKRYPRPEQLGPREWQGFDVSVVRDRWPEEEA